MSKRDEFEEVIRANFKVPEEAFLTRNESGYYNGHLNAYYKVWTLRGKHQEEKVKHLRNNLWSIVSNVIERRPNASMVTIGKQICLDIRAYLNDLK